jgi:pimeloyl-ACP methyl ester carboxylesterase
MVAKPAGLSQEARKLLVRHCCHESGADLFWANAKQLHYGWLAKLVTKPVLFIIGDRDPLRDRSRRHSFQALIRRYGSIIVVRETVLKECGHMPNVECPDRLAKAMVDFARELGYTFTAPAA